MNRGFAQEDYTR